MRNHIICYLLLAGLAVAADQYQPPELDKRVLKSLSLPKKVKLSNANPAMFLGVKRVLGIALPEQSGIRLIYVSKIPKARFANDLVVGDVIVAINGKLFGKDAIMDIRARMRQARDTVGFVWISRCRSGVVSRVLLDLGTRPLDLTKTGRPGYTCDWRLGPIGANGWCYHVPTRNGASMLARQFIITAVDTDGPAAGKLKVGDVVLGAERPFSQDARRALATAINEAEKTENRGKLSLQVWRPAKPGVGMKGTRTTVIIDLPVMGSFSATMPFDCAKTDRIIANGVEFIRKNKEELLQPGKKGFKKPNGEGWIHYINALGLLATGRDDLLPLVKDVAHACLLKDDEHLSVDKHVSMTCWWWSYKTVFLCEYYLRTKDPAVLHTIRELGNAISKGQSGVGTWGHTYASKEYNGGRLHGHLGGYGAINQLGLTLMIALPLVEKCGITSSEIKGALKRGNEFFSYFIEKGTIPYGDHGPANEWYDDNGKSGSAAIYFDLVKNPKGAKFFSSMVLASAPSGRESGHTGHFWSRLWGGLGAARGGERLTQAFFKEINWAYTLERQPNGRFVFQGNAGGVFRYSDSKTVHGDTKTEWDSTGARLLQLCIPRRALYLTGKETTRKTTVSDDRLQQLLAHGRLDVDKAARAKLTQAEIMGLLKDPLPPTRAMGAKILAERDINCVDKLMVMLDSTDRYEQYGAAEALCKAGFGSKPAADKLIEIMSTNTDVQLRGYAIKALINRDEKHGLLSVAKPAIPVLLKMAVKRSASDPRQVLQQAISEALFYKWTSRKTVGLIYKYGLDDVDRALLFPAMKALLKHDNGRTRSNMRWVYDELTKDELSQLWGDIYRASKEVPPSGIMFADGARLGGMHLMQKHDVKEGIALAEYIYSETRWGRRWRRKEAAKALAQYGAAAKSALPLLREQLKACQTGPKRDLELAKILQQGIKDIEDGKQPKLFSIADKIGNQ